MHCPEDSAKLEVDNRTLLESRAYICPKCHGIFAPKAKLPIKSDGSSTNSTLHCPGDGDILISKSGHFECGTCDYGWSSGEPVLSLQKDAQKLATALSLLFIVSVGLCFWQLGQLNSSADTITQTSMAPIKISAIVLWFFIFSFLFLVPTTIYHQMIISHRPHLLKTLHHPIVRWMPLIVIALIAINIYFLTP
jgi:hypothetical protein